MHEEFLEEIAQKNGLRETNTELKLACGLGAIVLCLLSSSFIPPLFIGVILFTATLFLARVDTGTCVKLYGAPLVFAVMSITGIILIYGGQEVFWRWDILPSLSLSVTRESINQGFFVFCRIAGGMSSLIFIAVTTPVTDIFAILRRCRIPEVAIDLMMIIYRTVFILLDQVIQVYNAQVMRLGYSGFRESIRSFASLCGTAFIASWDAGDDLIRAMDARCYTGKFALLGETRPVEAVPCLAVTAFLVISGAIVIMAGKSTIL